LGYEQITIQKNERKEGKVMEYDAIIIGGGLSGLTAASLLAKSRLKVVVIEKSYNPGGSCGIFKRNGATFDIGTAMLFGFGEKGFNAHQFVFNCLEEPIEVIKHDLLYCMHFKGHVIRFGDDIDNFAEELERFSPRNKPISEGFTGIWRRCIMM